MTELVALRDIINGCRKDVRGYADRVDKYHGAVQLLTGSLTECRRKVDEHELTLDGPPGNGLRPGLKTRMTALEGSDARLSRAVAVVLVLVSGIVTGVTVNWINSL